MLIPTVIYKDKNFIAINKPAGLLTHGVLYNAEKTELKEQTVVDWLIKEYPEIQSVGDDRKTRPGIVHRLDRDTSGTLIIARNQKFFDYFKDLLKKGEVKKTYIALVYGKIEKRLLIDRPIGLRSGTTRRSVKAKKMKMVKEAITEVIPISSFNYKGEYLSLVNAFPKTGRTHQIRIHLASIGHSIVGDPLYGRKKNPFDLKRQFLHAKSLEFNLENGKRIKIESELDEELKIIISKIS